MPLDPQVQALRFQREREKAPPLYTLSVEQARQADLASIRTGSGTPESVAQVINRPIPGPAGDIPLRLYQPEPRLSFNYFVRSLNLLERVRQQ